MFLSIDEFAYEHGVSRRAVRDWISDGLPTVVGPTGETLVDFDEGEAWLAHEDQLDDDEDDEGDVDDLDGCDE